MTDTKIITHELLDNAGGKLSLDGDQIKVASALVAGSLTARLRTTVVMEYDKVVTVAQGEAVVPTTGLIANRGQIPTNVTTIANNTTSRRKHWSHSAGSVTNIRCVDTLWYLRSSTLQPAAGADRTIKRYIEYPAGTFHQVKWSGAANLAMTNAAGTYKSDIVMSSVTGEPLTIPAGTAFYERTVAVVGGANFPVIETPAAANVLGLEDGNDLTDKGNSGTISVSTGVNTFGSAAFVGTINATNARSFTVFGDSIAFGQGDVSSVGSLQGSGWIARLLDRYGYPYTKIALGGQTVQAAAGSTASVAAFLAQINFSDAIFEYGVNDLRLSRTKAQIEADLQTMYALVGAAHIHQTTITPRSESTDSYATVANQTPKTDGNMADLTPLNADIRTGLSNVDVVIEAADAAMSARDSNVWGGPFPPVLDGTHPTSAKAAAMAAALSIA